MDFVNLTLETPEWGLFVPQLIVFLTATVLLFGDAFLPKQRHAEMLTAISVIGYGAAAGCALLATWPGCDDVLGFVPRGWIDGVPVDGHPDCGDPFRARSLRVTSTTSKRGYRLASTTFCWPSPCLVRCWCASAGDLLMIFIGLELSALATYVLTAYSRGKMESLEGALKYFLLGIFASAILLYGMAWAYGLTGSTDLDDIRASISAAVGDTEYLEASLLLALLLLVVGLEFQDSGGSVPHVDAGCLRRCADTDNRVYVGRSESRRFRGDDPDSRAGSGTNFRRLEMADRRVSH